MPPLPRRRQGTGRIAGRPHRHVKVVYGNDVLDGVEVLAPAFRDVVEQVDDPALVLRLLGDRRDGIAGAVVAEKGLRQQDVQGI